MSHPAPASQLVIQWWSCPLQETECLHESFDESMSWLAGHQGPPNIIQHHHDATTKRMKSSTSKITISKDENHHDTYLRLTFQFCKMCSESAFEDV